MEDILETIEKQQFVQPDCLLEHFWEMFVVDALLGNFDRHNGNWGFLYEAKTGESEIAPIYDCGSCLLPQADEKIMRDVLEKREILYARVYQFPTSAIKLDGRKINYYDFLTKAGNKDCYHAVKKIYAKVDMKKIERVIDEVPYISVLQKEFYKRYIGARFELILRSAYEI